MASKYEALIIYLLVLFKWPQIKVVLMFNTSGEMKQAKKNALVQNPKTIINFDVKLLNTFFTTVFRLRLANINKSTGNVKNIIQSFKDAFSL